MSQNMVTPSEMDGLFHGKSEKKMDDLEVPPSLINFRKKHIYIYTVYIYMLGNIISVIGYRGAFVCENDI